jgi:hypothetical protein
MPPRAKKATAAAPTPAEPTLVSDEAEPIETPAGPEPAPAPAEQPATPVEPDPEPPAAPVAPELPVATWQPGEPCRICFPMGPIPSAKAVGCEHGSWVLVTPHG